MKRITFFALMAGALLLSAGLTAPSASAQPNPARSLAGQRITVCRGEFNFRVVAISGDWRAQIVDRTAPRGFMWAVVVADLTNLGFDYGYPQGLVSVRDNRGRTFDWELFNGENFYVEDELAYEYDLTPSWAGAEAGATTRTVLPFLVAADATSLVMVPNDIGCSGNIVATVAPASGGGAPSSGPSSGPTSGPSSGPATAPPSSGGGAARTPASSLAGQSVTACKGEERYRFTVVSAYWDSLLVDRSQPGFVWAIALVDVTTLSPGLGYFQGIISVRDNRGRRFDWTLFNGPDIYVEDELAAAYYVQASWLPGGSVGQTVRTVAPFLVNEDATSLTLIPNNIGCGG